jgi:hypothetical protein
VLPQIVVLRSYVVIVIIISFLIISLTGRSFCITSRRALVIHAVLVNCVAELVLLKLTVCSGMCSVNF